MELSVPSARPARGTKEAAWSPSSARNWQPGLWRGALRSAGPLGSRPLSLAQAPVGVDVCSPRHRGLGRVPTPVPTGPSRLFFLPSFHPLGAPSSLWGIDAGVSAPTEQAPHLSPQLLLCISPPWVGGSGRGAGGGRHSRANQPGLGRSGAGLSDQPRSCAGKAPNTQLTRGVGTRCVTSPLSPLTPVYPGS